LWNGKVFDETVSLHIKLILHIEGAYLPSLLNFLVLKLVEQKYLIGIIGLILIF